MGFVYDITELSQWLAENENPCGHSVEFIESHCFAYKVRDIGFVYFHWVDATDLSIHLAISQNLKLEEWADIGKFAYFMGANRFVFESCTDKAQKLADIIGYEKGEDGLYFLNLPDPRVTYSISIEEIRRG